MDKQAFQDYEWWKLAPGSYQPPYNPWTTYTVAAIRKSFSKCFLNKMRAFKKYSRKICLFMRHMNL
jgi:hypothetical protein